MKGEIPAQLRADSINVNMRALVGDIPLVKKILENREEIPDEGKAVVREGLPPEGSPEELKEVLEKAAKAINKHYVKGMPIKNLNEKVEKAYRDMYKAYINDKDLKDEDIDDKDIDDMIERERRKNETPHTGNIKLTPCVYINEIEVSSDTLKRVDSSKIDDDEKFGRSYLKYGHSRRHEKRQGEHRKDPTFKSTRNIIVFDLPSMEDMIDLENWIGDSVKGCGLWRSVGNKRECFASNIKEYDILEGDLIDIVTKMWKKHEDNMITTRTMNTNDVSEVKSTTITRYSSEEEIGLVRERIKFKEIEGQILDKTLKVEQSKEVQEKEKSIQEKSKEVQAKEKTAQEKSKEIQAKEKTAQEKSKEVQEKEKTAQEKEKTAQKKAKTHMIETLLSNVEDTEEKIRLLSELKSPYI